MWLTRTIQGALTVWSFVLRCFLLQTSGDILQLHFLFVKLMNCYCHSIISPQLLQLPETKVNRRITTIIYEIYLTITKILSNFMNHKIIQVSHISESRCFIDSQNLCPIVPWIWQFHRPIQLLSNHFIILLSKLISSMKN